MRTEINNFKVKSLLLSGDYLCTSQDNQPYLLVKCLQQPNPQDLSAFRTTSQSIMFPQEIAMLSTGRHNQSYYCFPLQEGMTHCRVKGVTITNIQFRKRLRKIFYRLATQISNILMSHTILRDQLLDCLSLDNVWISKNSLSLLWACRKNIVMLKNKDISQNAMFKLGKIFYFLNNGKELSKDDKIERTSDSTNLNGLIIKMLQGTIDFPELTSQLEYLSSLGRIYTQCPSRNQRLIDYQEQLIIPRGKKSIQRTELSVERELQKQQRQSRQSPISTTKKRTNLKPQFIRESPTINFQVRQRRIQRKLQNNRYHRPSIINYSQIFKQNQKRQSQRCPILGKQHETYDCLPNQHRYHYLYRKSPDTESNRTDDSINNQISRLLRERALESFKKQKNSNLEQLLEDRKVQSDNKVHIIRRYKRNRQGIRTEAEESQHMSVASTPFKQNRSMLDQKLLFFLERREKKLNNGQTRAQMARSIDYIQETKHDSRQYTIIYQDSSQTSHLNSNRTDRKMNMPYNLVQANKIPSFIVKEQSAQMQGITQKIAVEKNSQPATDRVPYKADVTKLQPLATQIKQIKIPQRSPKSFRISSYRDDQIKVKKAPKQAIRRVDSNESLETINLQKATKQPIQLIPSKIIQKSPVTTATINRQINQYIDLINIIGYVGSKTYKSVKHITQVNPFTSVFFIYRRFFRQRKTIQKWLVDGECMFTRPGRDKLDEALFKRWLQSQQYQATLKKIKQDNGRIEQAVKMMSKKLLKQNSNNEKVMQLAKSQDNSIAQTTFSIEEALSLVNHLVEMEDIQDEMVRHMVNLLDALFIVSQLDGRMVKAVDVEQRRNNLKDLNEYFLEQETKIGMLKRIYKIY